MSRPTEIVIDIEALQHNCHLAQSVSSASKIVAVIKADAYGHGAIDIARALQQQVGLFAVSCLEEALDLREAGIATPILLLEGCFSADELQTASQQGVWVVMHNQKQLDMLSELEQQEQIVAWLKVDTGMHRLGVMPEASIASFQYLENHPKVSDIVLMSHFSIADVPEDPTTPKQIELFNRICAAIQGIASKPFGRSLPNSAGVLAWPSSHSDWDRPGIMLYGLSPFDFEHTNASRLKPVMSFNSKVIAVRSIAAGETVGYGNTWMADKPSVIATVAVGYGDGYPRNAKSGTPVLVNGQRARLCGRVSMDMITLDVSDLAEVKIDDHVELWGKQLCANEVAGWAGTIGYELVTRMPKRTRRRIVGA